MTLTDQNAKHPHIAPRLGDYLRQWLNLILAPLMWGLSSLSFFVPSARSPEGLSKITESLLVPMGVAFSIWFPIFVGCIAYGVIQAMGTNRTRGIYRKIGWWTVSGFALICVWALISAFASDAYAQWGTALVFIPAMLCLVTAMLVISQNKASLDKVERMGVWLPLSLIAGWTSLAVFLNWTPIVMNFMGTSVPMIVSNVFMLICALIWAAIITRKSGTNRAYAFPIIWGLSFVALKQLVTEQNAPLIGGLALAGALILIGIATYKPKSDNTAYETAYNYV